MKCYGCGAIFSCLKNCISKGESGVCMCSLCHIKRKYSDACFGHCYGLQELKITTAIEVL
jgi:hypothetical protein